MAEPQDTPPFDPALLKSDHQVVRWQPAVEVQFHKPSGPGAFGCAPGVLLLLVGPVGLIGSFADPRRLREHLIATAIFGSLGLVFGGLSWVIVTTSAAHTVVFDWAERELRVRTPFSKSMYHFSELQALELRRARTSGQGYAAGYCYCKVVARVAGADGVEAQRINILWTNQYRHDPEMPYLMVLPLVTDLATALNVPLAIMGDT